MKKDTHPQYYKNATATCICGATYEVGSTQSDIKVEICSACHPFFTGAEKVVDTAGRVERFKQRRAAAKENVKSKAEKKAEKAAQKKEKEDKPSQAKSKSTKA